MGETPDTGIPGFLSGADALFGAVPVAAFVVGLAVLALARPRTVVRVLPVLVVVALLSWYLYVLPE